jgi:hypothetical protein
MSVKRKIVAPELIEEREKCAINQAELKGIFFDNKEALRLIEKCYEDQYNDPEFRNSHKFYEWTRDERQLMWMKKFYRVL